MPEKSDLLTKRFRLSVIGPDGVSDTWIRWSGDPVLMAQLNVRPMKLSRADIQRYVAAAWKNPRMIIGIYLRATGDHIGVYEATFDVRNANVMLTVLIDQHLHDLSSVLTETDPVLLGFLASEHGMEKAVAKIVETYAPAIRHFEKTGWRKEGVFLQENTAVAGDRRLDVVQFGRLLNEKGKTA